MDGITREALSTLALRHPRMAISLTHQFLDGSDGSGCGYVPNDCEGATVCFEGQWWKSEEMRPNAKVTGSPALSASPCGLPGYATKEKT